MRPVENRSFEVEAPDLAGIQEALEALRPEGFDLVSAPVAMIKGAPIIKATGTFQRRDGVEQIEAEDIDALHSKVPEGWQLLSVRPA